MADALACAMRDLPSAADTWAAFDRCVALYGGEGWGRLAALGALVVLAPIAVGLAAYIATGGERRARVTD